MSTSLFCFVPTGGLGNRMRAIASAVTLADVIESTLQIYWFQDWGLQAPFARLFHPIRTSHVSLKDAAAPMRLLYDRPRRKNLFIPRLFQYLCFDRCAYERSITPLCRQHFDFAQWAHARRVYMASYTDFYPYDASLLSRLFVPVEAIGQRINDNRSFFQGKPAVGVHIRRTDHVDAIALSPTELFVERMDGILDLRPDTVFYLATDSESVKHELKKRYGQRLLTSMQPADRNSVEGIRQGVVEMYTLAHTDLILGSCRSSFSELAAQLFGAELQVVKK